MAPLDSLQGFYLLGSYDSFDTDLIEVRPSYANTNEDDENSDTCVLEKLHMILT